MICQHGGCGRRAEYRLTFRGHPNPVYWCEAHEAELDVPENDRVLGCVHRSCEAPKFKWTPQELMDACSDCGVSIFEAEWEDFVSALSVCEPCLRLLRCGACATDDIQHDADGICAFCGGCGVTPSQRRSQQICYSSPDCSSPDTSQPYPFAVAEQPDDAGTVVDAILALPWDQHPEQTRAQIIDGTGCGTMLLRLVDTDAQPFTLPEPNR
jgi:hypothetical protein